MRKYDKQSIDFLIKRVTKDIQTANNNCAIIDDWFIQFETYETNFILPYADCNGIKLKHKIRLTA